MTDEQDKQQHQPSTITNADAEPTPARHVVDMYTPITQLAYALEATRRVEAPNQDIKQLRLIYKYIVQRYAAGVLPAGNPAAETLSDLLFQFSLACAGSAEQMDFGRKFLSQLRPIFQARARTYSRLAARADSGEGLPTEYAALAEEVSTSLGQLILAERQTYLTLLSATNAVHARALTIHGGKHLLDAIATCGMLDAPEDYKGRDFTKLQTTSPCAYWSYRVSQRMAKHFAALLTPEQRKHFGTDEANKEEAIMVELSMGQLMQDAHDSVAEALDRQLADVQPRGGVDYAALDAEACADARREQELAGAAALNISTQEAAEAYAHKLLGPSEAQEETAALGQLAALGYGLLRTELTNVLHKLRKEKQDGLEAEQSFAAEMLAKHLAQIDEGAVN